MALGAFGYSMFEGKKDRMLALGAAEHAELTGVAVGVNCEAFEILNTERAQLTFMGGYVAARLARIEGPAAIAVYIVKRFSGRCMAGGKPHSLAELEFYDGIYIDVLEEMLDGDILSAEEYAEAEATHGIWFDGQAEAMGG